MKHNRGAAGLLILAEIIILVTSVVLGTVHKLTPSEQRTTAVLPSTESANDKTFVEDGTESADGENAAGGAAILPENFSEEVAQKISSMTLEEKVAQLFVVSPEELTGNELVNIAGAGTKSAIETYPVGGLVYNSRNYQGREQFRDLLGKAEEYSYERTGLYLFLAVQGESADGSAVTVMSQGYDAAPVVEMMAANQMAGENILQISVFPEQRENIVAELPWVMMSNQTAAGIADAADVPCSFSAEAVGELRNTMSYRGVILTGNLSEEAVTAGHSAGEMSVLAVKAGADMIYCPSNFKEAYQALLDAVGAGEISEEQINASVGHILTQKFAMPAPVSVEQTADGAGTQLANTGNNAGANPANAGNNTDRQAANAENNTDRQAANAENNAGEAANNAGDAANANGDNAGNAANANGDNAGNAANANGDNAGNAANANGDNAGNAANANGDNAGDAANANGDNAGDAANANGDNANAAGDGAEA